VGPVPLDWSYAIINATTEVSPTDTLTSMLNRVQQTVKPVLADTKRAVDALTVLIVGLQKGEGTVGQLLTKNTLAQQAEQAIPQDSVLQREAEAGRRRFHWSGPLKRRRNTGWL
jgi:hypothetical protein